MEKSYSDIKQSISKLIISDDVREYITQNIGYMLLTKCTVWPLVIVFD